MIEVQDLSKSFRVKNLAKNRSLLSKVFGNEHVEVAAVKNISFSIEKGEMVGFVGPNGAGKSTTIKMLTGILRPDVGKVRVLGLDPSRERLRYVREIGVVLGHKSQLWWDLPIQDTFRLLKSLYQIPERLFRENCEFFDDLLGLRDFSQRPVRQLSLGQRMRGDIAAALLHSPGVLFLDEPTIGLDLLTKEKIRSFLKAINHERKLTMLFTSHDLQDIETTSSRLIAIDDGRIVYDGAIVGLRSMLADSRTIHVELESSDGDLNLENCDIKWTTKNSIAVTFHQSVVTTGALIRSIESQRNIVDVRSEVASIEVLVKEIYQGRLRNA